MTTDTRTTEMEYVKTIGMISAGGRFTAGRGFTGPYALAISSDGRIYVVNRSQVRICVCDFEEQWLGSFGDGPGMDDGQLYLPTDMAFDSADRLYVTDEHQHRVSMFDAEGEYLGKWGELGSGDGQLNGPSGIAFDSQDNAYVVDQHNHRVQKLTRDGEYISQWGGLGDGEGQLNMPWGIDIDSNDDVHVADWRNDRIQKFTADGEFISQLGGSGQETGRFNRPADVAVDSKGYVYVADWGNERVQLFDPDGRYRDLSRGQATPTKWTVDFFESNADERDTRAIANMYPDLPDHLNDPYRASSQTEPFFWEPVNIHVDDQDRLYVTESRRHRFQIFQRGLTAMGTQILCASPRQSWWAQE